jgi:uncharacterized repeat protein (TIGR03803 family)
MLAVSLMANMCAVAQETVLYNFPCGATGCEPGSNLIFDVAGNLYGTTVNGGNEHTKCASTGCGVVYELTRYSRSHTK